MVLRVFVVLLVFASCGFCGDFDECFLEAAQRYGVDEALLRAIAYVESGMNEKAVNVNADGSEDLGLMQINSRWLDVLRRYGIDRDALMDGCVSIHVGAWILVQNLERYGHTWRAVGAYNAASEHKRVVYVKKVAPLFLYFKRR